VYGVTGASTECQRRDSNPRHADYDFRAGASVLLGLVERRLIYKGLAQSSVWWRQAVSGPFWARNMDRLCKSCPTTDAGSREQLSSGARPDKLVRSLGISTGNTNVFPLSSDLLPGLQVGC
jgi:hypothetical protein